MREDLKKLQAEVAVWQAHNFPGGDPLHPLLGIFEELGEISEAMSQGNREEVIDGCADVIIFMADLCGQKGYNLGALFSDAEIRYRGVQPGPVLGLVGQLSHSFLKQKQGIRGTFADHDLDIQLRLRDIIATVIWTSKCCGFDLEKETMRIWEGVRQRDFRRFPKNGKTE